MKPEEIHLYDWARIFAGQVPASFYIELVIRAFLVYALLMLSMRLLGKRMSTQISRLELAAMVSLAAAIGVPMLSPDRGILPAFIIAFVVVAISRLIASRSFKSEQFERTTQGYVHTLVEDSVMHYNIMQKARITRERLFAHLRSANLHHLGSVKRLYLEPNGTFTLIENEEQRPGLMVIPDWDKDFISRKLKTTDIAICKNCGNEKPPGGSTGSAEPLSCNNCGDIEWTNAVVRA